MIFARKMYKIPEFYMIFARKMPEFYIVSARKIFLPNFRGGACPPLSPTPMCFRTDSIVEIGYTVPKNPAFCAHPPHISLSLIIQVAVLQYINNI